MTATSPGLVAESASSTIDPDAQARRANDGELSAGFHSDLTIDEDAVDGLLTAEDFPAEFDENLDDGTWYAEYRRLAAEQAALRRLATLVARGVEPVDVFGAVAEEMRRCVPADTAGLWRFESDREITTVAAAADLAALARWPVGTRTPVDGNTLASLVQRSGRPARIDSYDNVAGPIAARVRAVGVRAAVGVPIIVDGRVWGLTAVGSRQPGPMLADTEVHISRFAELIATAVVAGHRDEQKRQLLAEGSQRSNLLDSLLEGRVFDEWNLREVAGHRRSQPQRTATNAEIACVAAAAATVVFDLVSITSQVPRRGTLTSQAGHSPHGCRGWACQLFVWIPAARVPERRREAGRPCRRPRESRPCRTEATHLG
jgi:GAF domain-containing protein